MTFVITDHVHLSDFQEADKHALVHYPRRTRHQ